MASSTLEFLIFNALLALCVLRILFGVKICHLNDFDLAATLPIRAVLPFLVVFTHLPICDFLKMGISAVGIYFFMSGYGMMVSLGRKGVAYLDGFVRREFLKLFVPALIMVVIWYVIQRYFGIWVGFVKAWQQLRIGNVNCFLLHAWFPLALMWLAIVFYVSARVMTGGVRLVLSCLLGVLVYYVR